MSYDIPNAFRIKFHDDFVMLSQQKRSRLEMCCRNDPDYLNGKFGYFDRIGATDAVEVTERHGNTPLVSTEHTRRRITLRDYDWADLIDKRDMRRFVDAGSMPQKYALNARMAMNRKKDDRIIAAMFGSAYAIDEDDAATAVPLPSGQKVLHGSAGLTLAKVLEAKEILDGNEVDEEIPRYAAVTSKQITNMLNTTEVKSADYNTVKALVAGQINSFLGFEWIRTERLTLDGDGNRQCAFFAKNALGRALGQEIEVDISRRKDKRDATQVYVDMAFDATRIEDEMLVEVACVES